ncbi:hypothetical protein HW115_17735 [Verrucomicrobiaceae bacterium N1E253]|uniref:Uncharacterized protein n=1 Tax=Oceaniferula marina TaxID=2748318 RepID=A0A851GIX8_9BACT|nr:hypothetical protein [Oceaniferula marina]NWK57463.1 hypothetical protein [Oceaniferula marina]
MKTFKRNLIKLLLTSILLAFGSTQSHADSANTNQIHMANDQFSLTCHIPIVIEADEKLYFYYKCTLKNTSNEKIRIHKQAQTHATKDGKYSKFKRYAHQIHQELAPGESTTWMQHAVATSEGDFKLKVSMDTFKNIKTSETTAQIKKVKHPEYEINFLNKEIQKNADNFPLIKANTDETLGSFHKFSFTNKPVKVGNYMVNAFIFEAPKEERDLVWSFNSEGFSGVWYILPVKGTMKGFTHFHKRQLTENNKTIGKIGDKMILQILPAHRMTPGEKYILWFNNKIMPYSFKHVTLSLNFPPLGKSSYKDVFPRGVY